MSASNVRDLGLIPGSGSNPLQYSCLENPMDRGAWWATVHGSQRVGHDWATSLSLHYTHTHACIQFSSVAQLCPTLCDPMNHSTLGLPVHHQLWEFTQTHVHWVSDAIQPSHSLSSPSPPAPNPSHTHYSAMKEWTFAICSNIIDLEGTMLSEVSQRKTNMKSLICEI